MCVCVALAQVNLLLKEYVLSGDTAEAERCLRELEVPHFHHEFVYEVSRHVFICGGGTTTPRLPPPFVLARLACAEVINYLFVHAINQPTRSVLLSSRRQ